VVKAAEPIGLRTARFLTWFALVVVLATDVAYLLVIRAQGGADPTTEYTVPFVAGYLVIIAAAMAASLMRWTPAVAIMPLRAAAAGGLLVLGLFAIFSIGLPLLVAGSTAGVAAWFTLGGSQPKSSVLLGLGAAAVAVAVLVVGFTVTAGIIVCPARGSMSGGGTRLVTGPYYYDCVNGELTYHSGSCNSGSTDANGNVSHPGC
jgi:hypothetical protein